MARLASSSCWKLSGKPFDVQRAAAAVDVWRFLLLLLLFRISYDITKVNVRSSPLAELRKENTVSHIRQKMAVRTDVIIVGAGLSGMHNRN